MNDYVRVPVPKLVNRHATAHADLDLTWACATERQAATMRAIFGGRYSAVPSRAAFAPGQDAGDADAVRMCNVCGEKPSRDRAHKCAACEKRAQVARKRERRDAALDKITTRLLEAAPR